MLRPPLEVSEWDGPCPAMWVRKTFASKFCRLPEISRSEGRDQRLPYKLYLLRVLSSSILPFKRFGLICFNIDLELRSKFKIDLSMSNLAYFDAFCHTMVSKALLYLSWFRSYSIQENVA